MLKSFAKQQNNINTTFKKPLLGLGKISSIFAIILGFFFGYIGIYAFIGNIKKKDQKSKDERYKYILFLILGILFIIFSIYLIFNFNNKKNLTNMGWNTFFQL